MALSSDLVNQSFVQGKADFDRLHAAISALRAQAGNTGDPQLASLVAAVNRAAWRVHLSASDWLAFVCADAGIVSPDSGGGGKPPPPQ